MIDPTFINKPTPNRTRCKKSRKPKFAVLHHSAGSKNGDLSWLTNPRSGVSCDFYVDKKGKIYKLNPAITEYYTYHAGKSFWAGIYDVNKVSVGIEMEHRPGEVWTNEQVASCAELCAWLAMRYKWDLTDNVGDFPSHRAVARPAGRKTDPENFPWAKFGEAVRRIVGIVDK